MTDEEVAYEQLLIGIQKYVDKSLADSGADITSTGVISAINSDGTYNVKINNIEYENVYSIGGTCSEYETVPVLIPQSNYNNMLILKAGSDSGSSSVTSYTSLSDKPQINSVTLSGNKSTTDLGLAAYSDIPTRTSQLTNDSSYVVDADYVHTDNNYTSDEKTKLSGIASGAQVNILEKVSVNGTEQTITSKGVDISVPTKPSDIGAMDATVTHLSGDVPISRTINGKALSADITLIGTDIGAGDAFSKDVDTSIEVGSTSTNLPTSQAVATFVNDNSVLYWNE